jgi:hypothetical protein
MKTAITALATLFLIATVAPAFAAGYTLADTMKALAGDFGPVAKQGAETYILGVENGVLAANAELKAEGKPSLYCPPHNVGFIAEQIATMLAKYAVKNPETADPKSPVAAQVAFMLVDTFPCH